MIKSSVFHLVHGFLSKCSPAKDAQDGLGQAVDGFCSPAHTGERSFCFVVAESHDGMVHTFMAASNLLKCPAMPGKNHSAIAHPPDELHELIAPLSKERAFHEKPNDEVMQGSLPFLPVPFGKEFFLHNLTPITRNRL
jgi:hypothetical protein